MKLTRKTKEYPAGTRTERLADFFVGLVSPRRRYLRGHFRRMERDPDYQDQVLTLMRARGYRNSGVGKTQTSWLGGNGSADQEIINDLPGLASKSREINRDDPLGSGIQHSFMTNVVGTGMRPQARTDNPERNREIERLFNAKKNKIFLGDDLTFNEGQRMIFMKALEDGNIFIKKTLKNGKQWFEVFEMDRLGTPSDAENKDRITNGIEKDAAGVRVAYWVSDSNKAGLLSSTKNYTRVPADQIVHLRFGVSRPGQTMGVPQCHAILQDLRDLDLLLIASLKRVQVAACLSVFLKSAQSTTEIMETTAEEYGYRMDQTLEPGMIFKLYPDEEVQTLIPNFPTPEFEPFIIMLARRIGAALGVAWQIVLKDFGKSNYSSARTDLLESRQTFVTLQQWFVEKLLNWIWAETLRFESGMTISEEELLMVNWIPNGWQWVDPKKEADAMEVKLRAGLTTRRDECAAQGKDWEEVQDQLLLEELREQEKRISKGLPPKQAAETENIIEVEEDDEEKE